MDDPRQTTIVQFSGAQPGCNFCKRPPNSLDYAFTNETRDIIVCDSCVMVLADKLHGLHILHASETKVPN